MSRVGRTAMALAVVAALAIAIPSEAAKPKPKKWYWSEEKAETLAASKIRIRFCLVFTDFPGCENGGYAQDGTLLKKGFYGLNEILCVGSDEKGETFTFARFRCRFVAGVSRYDYAAGRLLLFPTGTVTFRWQLSSIGRI